MKAFSIGAIWQETNPFIRREAGLLFPVAALFIAIPLALTFYVIPPEMRHMQVEPGTQPPTLPAGSVFAFLASMLFVFGGMLSLYALALKPGISLKEALILGFRRVPVALGASFLVGLALAVPLILMGMVAPRAAPIVMALGGILVGTRMLMLNAVVVDRPVGVIAALRASWELSKGQFFQMLIFLVVFVILFTIGQYLGNILFGLIGFVVGGKDLALQTGNIGAAIALALGQVYLVVMVSRIYRQLERD